ncbi:Mediator of RNA polymerase II transcription subunit 6 [Spraguea lophii 42_110]|uniref:Mediator of RNA polymerase II transcription subunit 6 n=1 Tax=Spraguea lophii (strain 42_110) TaxID=1358809 RepID=S7XQF0_SPRLO|nr:Mediator of RNA polymerase II transcription subunit 6 [Spraguea lophii 42_110]
MDNIEFFRNDNFLQSCPLLPINILEYFSTSPFYDNSCNNEMLKMQTQYQNGTKFLEDMVGLEYMLNYNDEENILFIIYKINRHSITDFTLLNIYYIIHGTIYVAPTDADIFKSRLSNFYFHLNEALDLYLERRTFNLFTGYEIKNDVQKEEDCAEDEIDRLSIQEFKKILKNK